MATLRRCHLLSLTLVSCLVALLLFLILHYNHSCCDIRKRGSPHLVVDGKHAVASPLQSHDLGMHDISLKHGYITPLQYSGQQGAGVKAIVSFQCMVQSIHLPMLILEPLVSNTKITAGEQSRDCIRFGDYFDLEHFNRESRKTGYTTIASREDFFHHAPRKTIVLWMQSMNKKELNVSIVWSSEKCYTLANSELLELFPEIAQFSKEGFCIVRLIRLPYYKHRILTKKDMRQVILGPLAPSNVTVMFTVWKTPWYVLPAVQQNRSSTHSDFERCGKDIKLHGVGSQFQPSPKILADAKKYENRFLGSKGILKLAVMLRTERLLQLVQADSTGEMSIEKCLKKVVQISQQLRKSKGLARPLVTLDLGKFGSMSLNITRYRRLHLPEVEAKAKSTLTALYDNQWTFEEWEESFSIASGGIENGGYIAALQRTIASRAECLILVGGGNFQDLALKGYMYNHPDRTKWCIHLVCVKDEENVRQRITNGV